MDITTRPTLQQFLADTKQGPYVSLYMSWPEHTPVEKLRIRFKNMLKHVKTVMAEPIRTPTLRHMLPNLNHMSKIRCFGKTAKQTGLVC